MTQTGAAERERVTPAETEQVVPVSDPGTEGKRPAAAWPLERGELRAATGRGGSACAVGDAPAAGARPAAAAPGGARPAAAAAQPPVR